MKVYVFMFKKFYVKNGVDYPMAIGNDDVKVFKKRNDAEIFSSEYFEEMKGFAGSNFLKQEVCEGYQVLFLKDGRRFVFEIIESELISNYL